MLWPKRPEAQVTAPIVLVGFGGFASLASLTVPDALVACFALGGLACLALALRSNPVLGWAGFGLCLGLAMLSKGTIGALHMLPTALLAPILWRGHRPPALVWYGGIAAALLLAILVALPWLLAPGGDIGSRLTALPGSELDMSDPRPWYWLLLLAPVLLFPWFWWKPLLRAWQRQRRMPLDDGLRLVAVQLLASLATCLATEARVAHGLLPALPMLALLIARLLTVQENKPKDYHAALPALPVLLVGLLFFLLNIVPFAHLDAVWREFVSPSGLPIWLGGTGLFSGLLLIGGGYLLGQAAPRAFVARLVQLALFPALVATSINIEFATSLMDFFDPRPVAARIQALETAGRPVAVFGVYRGEYDLPGRLIKPLAQLADAGGVLGWAAQHPNGIVVSYFQGSTLRLPLRPLMLGAAGDDWVALWEAGDVVDSDGAVLATRF
jgi:4-amino-4-deoxy-L-arabinose transferase-like glycosyltransferase